jgi:hypothetical protein
LENHFDDFRNHGGGFLRLVSCNILRTSDCILFCVVSSSPPDSPLSQSSTVVPARSISPIVIDLDDVDDAKFLPNHLKYQFAPSTMQNNTQSSALFSQPRTQSQSLPSRDPLGPLAQYPYLPYGDVQFSCRPGDPRLYDLISTLPMEPYGVLSWYIVDKEEELFEIDNTRDEDKVMQALWNRWIFLHRRCVQVCSIFCFAVKNESTL